MSLYRDTNVIYYTRELVNETLDKLPAELQQNFDTPLLKNASEYLVAVERLEISTNAIPYYDPPEENTITNKAKSLLTGDREYFFIARIDIVNNVVSANFQEPSYTIPGLIDNLNIQFQTTGQGMQNWLLFISVEGFITLRLTVAEALAVAEIVFPTLLNNVLGLDFANIRPSTTPGFEDITSEFPRWDMGDLAPIIRLTGTLPVRSDRLGRGASNMLTDIANVRGPISFSKSITADAGNNLISTTTNFTTTPRQNLVYAPDRLRWLNMLNQTPITNIFIVAEYVFADGQSRRIQLARGGRFSFKLAFYKRV